MQNKGLKHYDDFKAFIEYSHDIQDVIILKNTIHESQSINLVI